MGEDSFAQADLALNGISGATGAYLLAGVDVTDVARHARGETHDPAHENDLRQRHEASARTYGFGFGWNPQQLDQAGWGVVFASDVAPDVVEALEPLLAYRRAQAGERFRQYDGAQGHRPDDLAHDWLAREPRKKAPGPADPRKVPYYLMLVGDPQRIAFRFQYQLDVNYAVGRIHFDSVADYAHYAKSVVDDETRTAPQAARRALFFGVRNPGDRATQLSADRLVAPLVEALKARAGDAWVVETQLAEQATKAALTAALLGSERPSLLFTASHGIGFPDGDPRQLSHQGALLCQDWPGPQLHQGPIPPGFYFSAEDLPPDAALGGLIAFHFACYGAGTPKFDDYAHRSNQRSRIAPHAFLSMLSKRELALRGGGALAVVGHVERAWTYSFSWPGAGDDLTVFESAMEEVMAGGRIGAAMNAFGQRYADVAASLNSVLEEERFGAARNDQRLAGLWTANNDARSYVVVGDPAVRLRA